MPNPLSNKKKIRGWKNQLHKIDAWQNTYWQPNLAQLTRNQETYAKFWIDPWYRLAKRLPPLWFRRRMTAAMIAVAKNWQNVAQKAGLKSEVRIYLHQPHFMSSQLVLCAPKNAFYFPIAESQKNIPTKQFAEDSRLLKDFRWQLLIDENLYFEKLDNLSPAEINKLEKKAYQIETISSGDRCFHVKIGDAWVGIPDNPPDVK